MSGNARLAGAGRTCLGPLRLPVAFNAQGIGHGAFDGGQAMKKDPVCGMTIAEKDAAGTAEHQGTTYYFCSEGCRRKFVANPAAFVK
jgi:Cu+-exporting ATPase